MKDSEPLSEDKTRKAIKSCAKWLHYCLTIGWDKSQLDALEKIWWDHHDEKGNLKPNASQFRSKDNIPSLSEDKPDFEKMAYAKIPHKAYPEVWAGYVNGLEDCWNQFVVPLKNIPEPNRPAVTP